MSDRRTNVIYLQNVELDSQINNDTMKQEIYNENLISTKIEEEINPYQKLVLNNVYKDEVKTAWMEYWSILSDNVKYVQHDEESKTTHHLDVKTLDYRHHKKLYKSLKG